MDTDTAPKIKKTRLELARERASKAAALLQKLEALDHARSTGQKKQQETRRKVLIGAYMIEKMGTDESTKSAVMAGLDTWLTRQRDRALFGLEALPDTAPVTTAAPGSAPGSAATA